jgi:hypothetical protein
MPLLDCWLLQNYLTFLNNSFLGTLKNYFKYVGYSYIKNKSDHIVIKKMGHHLVFYYFLTFKILF